MNFYYLWFLRVDFRSISLIGNEGLKCLQAYQTKYFEKPQSQNYALLRLKIGLPKHNGLELDLSFLKIGPRNPKGASEKFVVHRK